MLQIIPMASHRTPVGWAISQQGRGSQHERNRPCLSNWVTSSQCPACSQILEHCPGRGLGEPGRSSWIKVGQLSPAFLYCLWWRTPGKCELVAHSWSLKKRFEGGPRGMCEWGLWSSQPYSGAGSRWVEPKRKSWGDVLEEHRSPPWVIPRAAPGWQLAEAFTNHNSPASCIFHFGPLSFLSHGLQHSGWQLPPRLQAGDATYNFTWAPKWSGYPCVAKDASSLSGPCKATVCTGTNFPVTNLDVQRGDCL